MNQGIYGFPTGPTPPAITPLTPILVERMNCSQQQATGNSSGTSSKVYYGPNFYSRAASNSTARNNLLYLTPYLIGRPCIIQEMVCGVVLPSTASNMIFGIFNSNPFTGFPEQCLYSSPAVATATSYNYSGPAPNLQINTPGWYWFGVVFQTNNAGNMQTINGTPNGSMPSSSWIANYQGMGLRCSLTYGSMPSSLASARFTLSESGSSFPSVDINMRALNETPNIVYGTPIA